MEIFKKLIAEGVISEDGAKMLEESVTAKLEEKKGELEKQTNEFLTEQYAIANTKINESKLLVEAKDEEIESLKSQLADDSNVISENVMKLEESTIKHLDLMLEEVVENQTSKEFVEKIAKLEIFEEMFTNLKKVFGSSLLKLDDNAMALVNENKEESTKLLSEKDNEIKVLKESLEVEANKAKAKMQETETLKKGMVLLKESDGLTDDEVMKMDSFLPAFSTPKGKVTITLEAEMVLLMPILFLYVTKTLVDE